MPSFQTLRTYNAHRSASVTALSVAPLLSSTQMYIASASIDGHVCVSSLADPKDVTLRNFGRPVQAVALSPDYKSDRAYLSGGLAGEVILTTGAPLGVQSNANTSSASQATQGWLGAIGLGGHGGKDTVLHAGEGTITAIKWSLSGKFVAWSNEYGIRIMRTHLHLDSADAHLAWTRVGFVERPNRRIWEEMAALWKARLEWVDHHSLESDEDDTLSANGGQKPDSTLPHQRLAPTPHGPRRKLVEKLVIGWGDTAWIVRVYPGGTGTGKSVGDKSVGRAEIVYRYVSSTRTRCALLTWIVYPSMIVLFLA